MRPITTSEYKSLSCKSDGGGGGSGLLYVLRDLTQWGCAPFVAVPPRHDGEGTAIVDGGLHHLLELFRGRHGRDYWRRGRFVGGRVVLSGGQGGRREAASRARRGWLDDRSPCPAVLLASSSIG